MRAEEPHSPISTLQEGKQTMRTPQLPPPPVDPHLTLFDLSLQCRVEVEVMMEHLLEVQPVLLLRMLLHLAHTFQRFQRAYFICFEGIIEDHLLQVLADRVTALEEP